MDHLQQVFNKLHDAHLRMKLSKCNFFSEEIQYLGHVLNTIGIKSLPSKTAAMKLKKPLKMLNKKEHFSDLLVTTAGSSRIFPVSKTSDSPYSS